jgi:hypothetical protein
MESHTAQKLYAYVDESGQETSGAFFLVPMVITSAARDSLRKKPRTIERMSGKQAKKWTKARPAERAAYLQSVLQLSELMGCIYYTRSRYARLCGPHGPLYRQTLHAQGLGCRRPL